MGDRLQEKEALEEVHRLRSRVRRDSRGQLAVVVLVAFWIAADFVSTLARNNLVRCAIALGVVAVPIACVWYLERTSKRFGVSVRAQLIGRFLLVHVVFLGLVFALGFLNTHIPEELGAILLTLALAFQTLGGALLWQRWYGSMSPWLFAFLTQSLLFGVGKALGISEGPWDNVRFVLTFVIAGYVCMRSTLRRLSLSET